MKVMKLLVVGLALTGGVLVANDAQARIFGNRSVSRTVTRTRNNGHHNSFNSFRGFNDPCYGGQVIEERSFTRIVH